MLRIFGSHDYNPTTSKDIAIGSVTQIRLSPRRNDPLTNTNNTVIHDFAPSTPIRYDHFHEHEIHRHVTPIPRYSMSYPGVPRTPT